MKKKRASGKGGELETLRPQIEELKATRSKLEQAEKALRESEERFRAVLSSVQETVIAVVDREGRNMFVGMSPELEKRYGLTARECVGKSLRDFMPARNAEEIIARIQELFRTGKPVRFETIVGFPGGDVWQEIALSPVRSSSGQITTVVAFARDVDEQKRTEEALRSSSERLQRIIDNTWDIIFQIDLKGNYTFANKAAERITGYRRAKLLRMNMGELLAPDSREQTFERLRSRVAGEPMEQPYELELIARDGQRKVMELTTTSVYSNGKLVGVQGIARDVTARKQAEAALRESEERFHNLVDNLPVGVYRNTPGPRGKFLMANRAIARLHGYDSLEEFLQIDVAELHSDPAGRKAFSDKLIAQGELVEEELQIRRKDGSSIWGAVTARVVRDADGRPAYFDGILEDISERKRAEEALRESEERMRLILENTTDGIDVCERDPKTGKRRLVLCNDRFVEMSGRSREELMAAENLSELIRSHTPPEQTRLNHDLLVRGLPHQGQASWIRPDGKENYYEWTSAPIQVGEKQFLIGIDRDLTQRRRDEAALRESEGRMRLILEHSTDGISFCERDPKTDGRRLLLCNDRFVEMSGRSREELMAAEDLSKFVEGHSTPEQERASHERLLRGLPRRGVASWIRPDGKENYYEWTAARVGVEEKQYLIGVDRDVTERRRAEEALRESEERMRLILEHSTDGINFCEIDPVADKRRLLLCNDRYVQMSGYTLEELMAADDLNPLELTRMSPEEKRINRERLKRGQPHQGQASWIRPDGSENYYEWTAAPFQVAEKTYVVGIDRDITGRMRTEAALREARRKLTTAREEERKRLAAELHDSVGQGLIALQLAMRNLQNPDLQHRAPERADRIAQARKQCDALIRDVRNMSRGLYPPTLELGLASALGALVRDFGAQDRVTVVCDIPQQAGRLPEDVEIALFRIAGEGLVNAVRHSQAKKISLKLAYEDGEALLTVRDDGTGFDRSKVVGKGLGLSMMNERAQAVDGELTIDSGAGGTSIRVRVPTTLISSGPQGG